jgi:hypothetical protein
MFTLLSRQAFREGVLKRDNYTCVFCNNTDVVAHHILERRLWSDGGYYLENGATVCSEHHMICEQTVISVDKVRAACGITKIHVPDHFYNDHIYDKWGNPVLEDGRRGKGELFFDESVQKVLKQGGVLPLFTPYVKYPRTHHLPWSPGLTDDDRMLKSTENFVGRRVIVSKKMDGECTSLYPDHVHARSIDSRGGEDRAWVKNFWARISYEIPQDWRIVGENLWAEHSIHYQHLESYFYGFSVWNERNICQSWDDTIEYFDLLGITPVPVLYDGIWDEGKIRALEKDLIWDKDEGYVVRLADSFTYADFKKSLAKYVRKGHVQTAKHWRQGRAFIPNELK